MKADKLFNVSGHVTFVTGAASGIGLAMAEVMAENGARVTMADVNVDGLREHGDRLRKAGFAVETVALDVTDLDKLRATIDGVAKKHSQLDVVFANAGASTGPGPGSAAGKGTGEIDNVTMESWEKALRLNQTSVFATMQGAAAQMKKQKSGRIIVTASIAGLRSEIIVGYGYTATKAAIINIVRHAALELGPYNICVNAICPGVFKTNIGGGRAWRDPVAAKEFSAGIPLGRMAETDEMKGLALYLASPASSYLTGAIIPIDGGITAGR
jgi:NAD(P)-dependent dehydrogenase (short-subunit alcohol dehydrogenase family)